MNLPRATRQASVFSCHCLTRYFFRRRSTRFKANSARKVILFETPQPSSVRFLRIAALLLAIVPPVFVSFAHAQGGGPYDRVISGTLRNNGVPVPNFTFFVERSANGYTGKAVTTNNVGQYSVTFENCAVGWPNQYYWARFVHESGGLNPREYPFWYGYGICSPINQDLVLPAGAMDGRRYNAGPGITCPVPEVGKPVNVTNGNMWLQQTDYVLPGTVGGINVTRTYNSGINVSGIFGNGWSSDYEAKLLIMPSLDNEALIRLDIGTGLVVDFLNTGSGTYESTRSGLEGKIPTPVAPETEYTLTWKDGRTARFSATGQLLWNKDRNLNQTSFSYTATNLTGITDPFGRSVAIAYTTNGKVSQITDSIGTIATYGYDTSGEYLTSVTYADGSKYQFEYVTVGTKTYLATVKDALNNVLETHQYDSVGRATTSEIAGGAELYTIDYSQVNAAAPYSTVTDGLGRITKYYFDGSKGRNAITKIEGACGCAGGSETTQYEYDSRLNITKVTDALLNETTYTYDGLGNRLTQTDVLGTQSWTYNNLGQVLTYNDRVDHGTSNNTVINVYDSVGKGNLETTSDRLGYTTTLTYTNLGQIETVTDARSKTTTLTYDSQGRLEDITDANGKVTAFGYDGRARLTSLTNAKSETTTFTYDLNNRPKRTTFPDANYLEHTYDLAGRKTATRDPRGYSTAYVYDGAYRLTSVTDALSHARTFGYDLMSNLTSQTDALGNTTNFEYDDFNRLNKVVYPPASTGITRLEESTTYDKLGNVKTRVDTAGRTTSYDYDTSSRLTKITDALTNQTNFEYNLRSQLTKVKDALNQEYVFTYDPLGRKLTETRAGTTMSYLYDEVGNRTKRTDHNGTVTNYAYDNLNRLTSGSMGTYTYDDLSRILTAANSNGTVSFTYDNRGRVDTTTDVYGKVLDYDYDANGNRIGIKLNGTSLVGYSYDNADRLASITNVPESAITNYGYDIADRLTSKALPNGIATSYSYDDMSRLTRIKDANSTTTLLDRQYGYNAANQISTITDPARTRTYSYDNVDRLTGVSDLLHGSMESYAYDAV
ncbi:MAG TPA: DUF6531 domain-containing protein, partial [Pyrinomonadaceae bacterium]|nr:DUF6531 domain-containing protein [Pyrinomonadaceae bacterium]